MVPKNIERKEEGEQEKLEEEKKLNLNMQHNTFICYQNKEWKKTKQSTLVNRPECVSNCAWHPRGQSNMNMER